MLVLPDESHRVLAARPFLQTSAASRTRSAFSVVDALVDPCNLGDPTLTLGVLERQYFLVRPVKVIRNVRYLLIEPL
jgi:hypothetical protein